ncbi:hypothetical protein GCM10008961_30610 [Deinococcus knuensis]|uniref:Uncharacterized protein n=1 Tax=Deinococcus knuensis TaxID=1837380 RepID=A0ABQ2SQ60_9DEIO|nr:hypothetical protein GCM10008961_30610 [Deinococcus knuensis]
MLHEVGDGGSSRTGEHAEVRGDHGRGGGAVVMQEVQGTFLGAARCGLTRLDGCRLADRFRGGSGGDCWNFRCRLFRLITAGSVSVVAFCRLGGVGVQLA